jgi:hypothetical protein
VSRGLNFALCAALAIFAPAAHATERTTPAPEIEELAPGDDLQRVLSFLRHPESGVGPARVRVRALTADGVRELRLDGTDAGAAPPADAYLVDLTQECDTRSSAPDEAPFTSWLFLPANRLAAWDVQVYAPGCQPEPRLFEASDHGAMRRVGQTLFRPAHSGRFRYGTLVYTQWEDAFAAPSREATLSLLKKRALEHPGSGRAQNELAVGLYAAGERDAALAALARAVQLAPDWDVPHDNLAIAHRQRGDLPAAEREARLAEALRAPAVGSGPHLAEPPRSGLRAP